MSNPTKQDNDPVAASQPISPAPAVDFPALRAKLALAQARLRRSDMPGAEHAAGEALAIDPLSDEAELVLAQARLRNRNPVGAQEAADRVLGRNPGHVRALALLAVARLQNDDPAGAEETALRALAVNPWLDRAELTLAQARLRNRNPSGAQEAVARVLARNPEHGEALALLAVARLQNGDPEGAEEAALRALAAEPELQQAALTLAQARLRSRNPAGAQEAANRLLARNPRHAGAHVALAAAQLQSGDAAGAQESALRALALDQTIQGAELILGDARLKNGDPVGAEEVALRVLERDPRSVRAAKIAAQAADRQDDPEKAATHYRRLAEIAPDELDYRLRLVHTLNLAGRAAEARRELDAVSKIWTSDVPIERLLEQISVADARFEDAIREGGPETSATDEIAAGGRSRFTQLRSLAKSSPADTELARPVVKEDPESDILIAECKGADTVVLVFAGINDRVGFPLRSFDRYLASLGVSAIYLKDFRRLLFVKGIKSLGDNYAETLAGLKRLTMQLNARRLCTIGNSGGARAAVHYGVDLQADNIVAFAAATGTTPCLNPEMDAADRIIGKRTLENSSPEQLDLRLFLERRSGGANITFVYCENSAPEAANALRLSEVRGVTLRPVGGSPPTILALAKEGNFAETLAELLGVETKAVERSG